jgi:hypothetical protein
VTELPSRKKKFEVSGKFLQKNSYSPNNPLVPRTLETQYKQEAMTPERPKTPQIQKKMTKKGIKDRQGNLLGDADPPKQRLKTKVDFVSHITALPGKLKVEVPLAKTGDIERYRARQMLRTEPKPDRYSKQMIEGQGKWKSSIDILKNVVSSKSNS